MSTSILVVRAELVFTGKLEEVRVDIVLRELAKPIMSQREKLRQEEGQREGSTTARL